MRYRLEYQIVDNHSSAHGGWGGRASHNSVSRSAASDVRQRRAEQIVRFARPDILFYDEFVIGLYHRICAL